MFRKVTVEAPPSGAPVFGFLDTPPPTAVPLWARWLELMGLRPGWVAEFLKVSPTLATRWRLARSQPPEEVRFILAWAGTQRLQALERFWEGPASEILAARAYAELPPLEEGWQERAREALALARDMEAEVYAENTHLSVEAEHRAVDRLVTIKRLPQESAAKMHALIEQEAEKAKAEMISKLRALR